MNKPTLSEFQSWINARQAAAVAAMNTGPLTPAYDEFKRTATVIREIDAFLDEIDLQTRADYLARRSS